MFIVATPPPLFLWSQPALNTEKVQMSHLSVHPASAGLMCSGRQPAGSLCHLVGSQVNNLVCLSGSQQSRAVYSVTGSQKHHMIDNVGLNAPYLDCIFLVGEVVSVGLHRTCGSWAQYLPCWRVQIWRLRRTADLTNTFRHHPCGNCFAWNACKQQRNRPVFCSCSWRRWSKSRRLALFHV